jgi:hypothetical protein
MRDAPSRRFAEEEPSLLVLWPAAPSAPRPQHALARLFLRDCTTRAQVLPWMLANQHNRDVVTGAYDADMWTYLHTPAHHLSVREYLHLYQVSTSIVNLFHTDWTEAEVKARFPDAVMVHGGTRLPSAR